MDSDWTARHIKALAVLENMGFGDIFRSERAGGYAVREYPFRHEWPPDIDEKADGWEAWHRATRLKIVLMDEDRYSCAPQPFGDSIRARSGQSQAKLRLVATGMLEHIFED